MIDSNKTNENVGAATENEVQQVAGNVVTGTINSIENGEAKISFGENESDIAIIPIAKLAGEVAVGNVVKLRLEEKNGSTTVTEVLSHEKPSNTESESQESAKEGDILTGTIVAMIVNNEVTIKFGEGNEERGTIPYARFTEKPMVGDIVKVRLGRKSENELVITDIVSHEKPNSADDVPFEVESHETEKPGNAESEHPTDDDPNKDIKAKVFAIDFNNNVPSNITLILLDTNETVTVPPSVIGFEVKPGMILNLEVEQDGDKRTIKAAQIASSQNADEAPAEDNAPAEEEGEDEIDLRYIPKELMLDVMAVPTHSKLEYRMVTFIMQWARRNNIQYDFDSYGNIYLTKGELEEGEFYPCVTSHMDTVQYKHDPYIYAGVPLALTVEKTKDGDHKLSVNNEGGSLGTEIGIGADCKAGIVISLALFDHMEKLKACFFLDEETGCNGSDHMDLDWFKDVGYVVGFDSPDLYRAAWCCQGTRLFN